MQVEVVQQRSSKTCLLQEQAAHIQANSKGAGSGAYDPKQKQMPFWRTHGRLLVAVLLLAGLLLTSRASAGAGAAIAATASSSSSSSSQGGSDGLVGGSRGGAAAGGVSSSRAVSAAATPGLLPAVAASAGTVGPTAAAAAGTAAAKTPPKELFTCINEGQPDQQLTTYRDFAYQKPARMKLYQAWWSQKDPVVKVTIVTGLNPSRLNQLESQCTSYKGPISAAVYVVLHNPDKDAPLTAAHTAQLDEAKAQVDTFHKRMEAADNCQLDILLLYEVVSDEVMKVMFPINSMRNYALLQARTPLVAMVDVDLIVSNALLKWLLERDNYTQLRRMTDSDTVVVLPAFETAPQKNMTLAHQLADAAAMMTKAQLGRLVQRKLIYQFALYLFRQGHNCTDYARWFKSEQPYDVEYHDGYEPWFIIDRFRNPWYDVSFRGYGWNKVSHVLAIFYKKYKFLAHPSGFIVHRQHSRSNADKMYQAQKRDYERDMKARKITPEKPNNNLAGLTHRFRDRVQAEMAAGNYTGLLDDGISRCVATLPWWRKDDPALHVRNHRRQRSLLGWLFGGRRQ